MQRILQPGEIESLDRIDFPRIRLPHPASHFAERAARLRQLAPGHAIGDYLRFMAVVADAQAVAAKVVATIAADQDAIERALRHGMPALPAQECLDPAWRDALRLVLEAVVAQPSLPGALLEAARTLAALDSEALERRAREALDDVERPGHVAARPLLLAALQVAFAVRASKLDVDRIAYVDPATICPVCGSAPVASVLRVGGAAGGHRYLHCALCATEWHLVRVKCSHCESTRGVRYQGLGDGDQVVLAETCDQCGTYRKQVNQEKDPLAEPLADDLASLLLDLLMAGTPYSRASGNPALALPAETKDREHP